MTEDLSKQADGYAIYLPAIQQGSARKIVAPTAMRTSGSSPTPLRMSDLNWLDPHNRHWRYKWCLASAAAFRDGGKDDAINTAHADTVIFGDSAGYQIGTGALPELQVWLKHRASPEKIIAAWKDSPLPIQIMRWLETSCDYGMTIDMPLWAKAPERERTPFHYLSEQQLIDLTVLNLELISKQRDPQSRCKFLNVLQAYTPTGSDDDYLASEERWFAAVKDYPFEGWALGGEVGARGGVARVLRRLLILRDLGLLVPPRSWCHILGVSTTIWAVCLTAIQQEIRSSTNRDFTISFDSASAYKAGGMGNQYVAMPAFGEKLSNWTIPTRRLPSGFAVATSATMQPFPASSPIADYFTLQDINPRKDKFAPKTMDDLGDQLLLNHNVYVYVRAMIEANNAVFVTHAAPQSIMDAVSIIQDICRAKDWPTVLSRRQNSLTAATSLHPRKKGKRKTSKS